MSDDKIAEIRKRHEQSEKNYIELESTWKAQIHEDRSFLLAEVERLRAALRECACACSSIRECVSEWARDGKCPHADACNALEGRP